MGLVVKRTLQLCFGVLLLMSWTGDVSGHARSLVMTGRPVIGSSVFAFVPDLFTRHNLFFPFALDKGNRIDVFNSDVTYTDDNTPNEWFAVLRDRDWSIAAHSNGVAVKYLYAQRKNGHWTKPFFDCGGANVWMVSFAAPVLGWKNGKPEFRGVATIDIHLNERYIKRCIESGRCKPAV